MEVKNFYGIGSHAFGKSSSPIEFRLEFIFMKPKMAVFLGESKWA
jgi:hypothetical protein